MKCKHTYRRNHPRYDSLYCVTCRAWLETRCRDKKCGFCKDRPAKAPNQKAKGAKARKKAAGE